MEELHSLLRRQLRKHFSSDNEVPAEWKQFVSAVNDAYKEFDEDRYMLELSLELSSNELLQANTRMRAVLHAFPDLFLWLDKHGVILQCWSGSDENLYIPSRNLVGMDFNNVPEPVAAKRISDAFGKIRQTQKVVSVEYELTINQKRQHYEARLMPLISEQYLATVRNITERKKSEEVLNTEKERLAATLRSIADGVITADKNGNIILINQVAQNLTGWDTMQKLGISQKGILGIVNNSTKTDGQPPMQTLNRQVVSQLKSKESFTSVTLKNAKGKSRSVAQGINPVYDLEGQISGAVIVLRDETNTKLAEEERIKSTKLASLGLLAGGLAHDFNNILAGILSNISLARAIEINNREIVEMLEDAEMACDRAKELTKQLMTFSKGGTPIKTTASIEDLAREISIFALRGSNVRCIFDIPENLWSVEIDIGQMSQVINNLVINANQAMPNGGVFLIKAFNAHPDEHDDLPLPGKKHIKLMFSDQGDGIPHDIVPQIFDPYFSTKEQGSGLGLATSYSIVQKHHGTLSVESSPGKGCVFTLCLPAIEIFRQLSSIPARPTTTPGSGRVLIMDDEEQILKSTGRLLRHSGFEPAFAFDGEEAIAMCIRAKDEKKPFDVVIMDLTIAGGMGGQEATKILRSKFPKLKIIASSGYSTDPIMSSYTDYGFSDILPKPYSLGDLSEMLDRNR